MERGEQESRKRWGGPSYQREGQPRHRTGDEAQRRSRGNSTSGHECRLVVDDDVGGGQATAVGCGAGRNSKAEGHVSHRVNHDALVLWRVLCDTAQAGLEDVIAVEKRKLG